MAQRGWVKPGASTEERPSSMKVCLRYQPDGDDAHALTLRITLTKKYIEGTGTDLLTLFKNYFSKKFPDTAPPALESLTLKVAGEGIIGHTAVVGDYARDGADM